MDAQLIEYILIFGAVQGAIFALLAMGFSLLYGVGGILNLAHGYFYILTGYIVLWLLQVVDYIIAIPVAIAIMMSIGALTYLGLIKRFIKSHVANVTILMITFALAFLLEQFIRVVELERAGVIINQSVPRFMTGIVVVFGVNLQIQNIIALIGSIIMIVSVLLFIEKTKVGKTIRAVSQDREAASLMGIDVNKTLMVTMMISCLLVGVAAVLYVPEEGLATYRGWNYLIISFSIVVLGGLGSPKGSVIAAFIIAYITNIFNYIDPALSELAPIVIIIIILIFRPYGLLGKKEIQN